MENYENPQVDEVLDVDAEEPELDKEVGPLDGLLQFMREQLEKEDAKGLAEVYKTAGDYILRSVAAEMETDQLTFTPEDIDYLDGYFIFAMGSNSVLHFHVKECPGWKFGIWFNEVETDDSTEENKQYRKDVLGVEFFAQYEETIDKFKPSASTITERTSHLDLENHKSNWWFIYQMTHTFQMIMKYPTIMWYRDMYFADLNHQYVTIEEANEKFTEWRLKENNKILIQRENDQVLLDALKYIAGPILEEGKAFIFDHGENCWPRYELVILNEDDPEQDGSYGLFGDDYDDAEADEKYWDEKVAECEKRARDADVYYHCNVSHCFMYRSKDKFEHMKQWAIKE